MADNKQTPDPAGCDDAAATTGDVDVSRRRFSRAGLSVTAVLTLASRPALATRCSVSGMNSIDSSIPGVACQARPPHDYASNQNWHNYLNPDEKFNNLGLNADMSDPNLTVIGALNLGGADFRREATAGLLNSMIFGTETFGYNASSFRTYLVENNGPDLYMDIYNLNRRP